jgi:hypothetical protein
MTPNPSSYDFDTSYTYEEWQSKKRVDSLEEQNIKLLEALNDIVIMTEQRRIFEVIKRAKAEIAKAQGEK